MSNDTNRAGMCAAFGCPLLGSLSTSTLGDGKWMCFCHFGKEVGANDAVTSRLNSDSLRPVVQAIIDIRRFAGTDEWTVVYKGIKNSLKGAAIGLCYVSADGSARGWLQRMEGHLIQATRDAGKQARLPITKPTAPVVGPTHASGFIPYGDEA